MLPILVKPRIANRAGGIVDGVSSRTYRPAAAVNVYNPDVTNRNDNSCNLRPPLVVYSRSNPYATKDAIIPTKHINNHTTSVVVDDVDAVAS